MTNFKRKYKRVTQQDIDFAQQSADMKVKDIASALGISLSSAYNLTRRNKIGRKEYFKFDDKTTNKIVLMYNDRYSYREIADSLNLKVTSVATKINLLRKKGVLGYKFHKINH